MKRGNDLSQIDFKQGTINFWVKGGKVDWAKEETFDFLSVSRDEGQIHIFKDGKKLKAEYQFNAIPVQQVSVQVGELSSKEDHQIVFSWSTEKGKIILFLDGEKVAEKPLVKSQS